jgi:fatty acid desaturase
MTTATATHETDELLARERAPFSFAEARHIVRDLYEHRVWIYWTDFLGSLLFGYLAFTLCRRWNEFSSLLAVELPTWLSLAGRGTVFLACCACYFRAVNFIHEVVHLPDQKFWFFKIIWNLLCGVPFLTPSFTHEGHLDHHRRKLFGTAADGEYLPLARLSRWWILVYLSQALWAPPIAVLRFGVLTPLSWFSVRIRDWVHRHCSSLVMDPRYSRPLPGPKKLWAIRIYEFLCFAWICGVAVVGVTLDWDLLLGFVAQVYATGVVVILMNCLRTMGAHRFRADGHETTFLEQLLDSVNIDSHHLIDIILAPVGLRFHATHHLFPAIPYHNLPAAHRRLMAELPDDSPYRLTNEPSLFVAIYKLCQRSERAVI